MQEWERFVCLQCLHDYSTCEYCGELDRNVQEFTNHDYDTGYTEIAMLCLECARGTALFHATPRRAAGRAVTAHGRETSLFERRA
jgi:hypothetical protein